MRSRLTRYAGALMSLWSLVVTGGQLTARACDSADSAGGAPHAAAMNATGSAAGMTAALHVHAMPAQAPTNGHRNVPPEPCHCPGCVCGCVTDAVVLPTTLSWRGLDVAVAEPVVAPAHKTKTAPGARRPHALPFASGPPAGV